MPWRSGMESRVIEQLVWQWFLEARGWGQEAGEKQKQVSHHHPARAAGWVRDDSVRSSGEWRVTSDEQAKAESSGEWLAARLRYRYSEASEWPTFAEATARQASGEKRQQQVPRRLDKEHGDSLGMTNIEDSLRGQERKQKQIPRSRRRKPRLGMTSHIKGKLWGRRGLSLARRINRGARCGWRSCWE